MRTFNLKFVILVARGFTVASLLLGNISIASCYAAEIPLLAQNGETIARDQLVFANQNDQDFNERVAEEEQEIAEELDDLYDKPQDRSDLFPEVVGGHFRLPALAAITTATSQIGNGRTPDGFRKEQPVTTEPLPEAAARRGQPWNWSIASWAAANTFSYPLYFEDRMLERHGHTHFGYLQPGVSGTRFLAQAIMLPYLTALDPPCECSYTLGYYRSGSCAPAMIQRPPFEWRAAINQAIWLGGGIAIFP